MTHFDDLVAARSLLWIAREHLTNLIKDDQSEVADSIFETLQLTKSEKRAAAVLALKKLGINL